MILTRKYQYVCNLSCFPFQNIFGARTAHLTNAPFHARNKCVFVPYIPFEGRPEDEQINFKFAHYVCQTTYVVDKSRWIFWANIVMSRSRTTCFSICHLHARAVRLRSTGGENLIRHDCSYFQCRIDSRGRRVSSALLVD